MYAFNGIFFLKLNNNLKCVYLRMFSYFFVGFWLKQVPNYSYSYEILPISFENYFRQKKKNLILFFSVSTQQLPTQCTRVHTCTWLPCIQINWNEIRKTKQKKKFEKFSDIQVPPIIKLVCLSPIFISNISLPLQYESFYVKIVFISL